jgi:hypothetical protein
MIMHRAELAEGVLEGFHDSILCLELQESIKTIEARM